MTPLSKHYSNIKNIRVINQLETFFSDEEENESHNVSDSEVTPTDKPECQQPSTVELSPIRPQPLMQKEMFKCQVCNERFTTKRKLMSHVETHIAKKLVTFVIKVSQCHVI